MAKGNIPVGLFYASYPSDCTYELNSRKKEKLLNRAKRAQGAGKMAGTTRLELATFGVTGRRSNQLNYAPIA